jgi:hypothetical protein
MLSYDLQNEREINRQSLPRGPREFGERKRRRK